MKIILFVFLISLFFTSCNKDRITADGNLRIESRIPGRFNEVHSSGSNRIHIVYGTEYKVELKGSGNLITRFRTSVYNQTLNLGYERVNVSHDDIEIVVTMPSVSAVSLSGSGEMAISGKFPDQDSFNLRISGSAKTNVLDTFRASKLGVDISGSGDANLEKILSKQSVVKISGSGDVRLTAEETLKVSISGSGKVFYGGNPIVDTHISGSGKVIKY